MCRAAASALEHREDILGERRVEVVGHLVETPIHAEPPDAGSVRRDQPSHRLAPASDDYLSPAATCSNSRERFVFASCTPMDLVMDLVYDRHLWQRTLTGFGYPHPDWAGNPIGRIGEPIDRAYR